MHHEEESPVLSQSNHSIALLIVNGGIFNLKERIEEDLTCFLKRNTMLSDID